MKIQNVNCAGCFSCYNVCPKEAIEMTLSQNGFYVPKVKEELCKKCEICEKVCPLLNPSKSTNYLNPKAYAAWSLDEYVRFASSSGGVFSEIAKYVIQNKGVVYGVAFDYEKLLAKHVRINNIEELEYLRGSKYIPSWVGKTYKMALDDIESGSLVLFSGTPCQIAGLKNFLRTKLEKEPENLITVDLVCHGVPSLRTFWLYLNYISKGKNKKINKVGFRDKETGWENYQIKVVFEDGSIYKKIHKKDPFFKAFLWNLCLNTQCYNCQFSRIPREGDITLGDFWGVEKTLYDKKGVSLVLLNNEKAQNLFRNLNNLRVKEVPFSSCVVHNPRIVSGNFELPTERDKVLKAKNFREILLILLKNEIKRKISELSRKVLNR